MSWRVILYCLLLAAFCCLLVVLRILQVIKQTHAGTRKRLSSTPTKPVGLCDSDRGKKPVSSCRLVVFLGSGGHTGEMIRLLHGVDFEDFPSRLYLVSSGDNLSLAKAAELEAYKVKMGGKQQQQLGVRRCSIILQACLLYAIRSISSYTIYTVDFTLPHRNYLSLLPR